MPFAFVRPGGWVVYLLLRGQGAVLRSGREVEISGYDDHLVAFLLLLHGCLQVIVEGGPVVCTRFEFKVVGHVRGGYVRAYRPCIVSVERGRDTSSFVVRASVLDSEFDVR